MRVITLSSDEATALAVRLASYGSMRELPLAERAWLVAHGEYRTYDAGDKVVAVPNEAEELVIVLSGRVVVYFGHGSGRRHAMESLAGSLTGVLPYSRLKRPQWDVLVEEPSELLAINKSHFPQLIIQCPVFTESLVHAMLDRARRFAAANWEDEKVTSIGRLAAGLSHELNNPAAAAASGAKRLATVLTELGAAAHAVGAAGLHATQQAAVGDLVARCQRPDRSVQLGALERADREEHMTAWLERHALDPDLAATLVDGGVAADVLDPVAGVITGEPLSAVVRWIAAAASAAVVASDVERATRRINDVVQAVRGYSYMDRAPVREATDIGQGLRDTVEVIRAEANGKGATVRLEIATGLPLVSAVTPDLNQVWANLLQNALDAEPPGGEITVTARAENGSVIVCVVDNGAGIPEDVQPRIFDPFFTTKPAGAGVGLGLDIVRRIVRSHDGDVEFESRPGRTTFRVRLPVGGTR